MEQAKPGEIGRPTKYTKEIDTDICDRLAGGESLTSICSSDDMPSCVTVYDWLKNETFIGFLNRYTQARERQAETFIDQCIDIADETSLDTITKTNKDGDEYEVPNHEWITRSRLKVDTRIKIAEKLAPLKYTPRKALEHSGTIGLPDLTDEQVQKQIETYLSKKEDK